MTVEFHVAVPICCDSAFEAIVRDDTAFTYVPWTRTYLLRLGIRVAGPLTHCPWCGKPFPPSLEAEWKRRVIASGGEAEFPELLPLELRSSRWWDGDTDVEVVTMDWPPDLIERNPTEGAVREQLARMTSAYTPTHRLLDASVSVGDQFRSRRRDEYHYEWDDDTVDRQATSVAVFVGEDADGEPLTCRVVADGARILTASWLRNDGGACFPGVPGQQLTLHAFAFKGDAGIVHT